MGDFDSDMDDLEDGQHDDGDDEDYDAGYEEMEFDLELPDIDNESAAAPDARLHQAPSIAAELNDMLPLFSITVQKSLDTLTQMGFEEEDAFMALKASGCHVGAAAVALTQSPLSESGIPRATSPKELLYEPSRLVATSSAARAREDLAQALMVKRAEEESLLEQGALSTSASASGDSTATSAAASSSHVTASSTTTTTPCHSRRLSERRMMDEEEAGISKDDLTRISLPDTWSDSD
jgi:hypothetical protein